MATRTIELLSDDLDGSEGDVETVTFALGSTSWEIDLSADNRAQLDQLLQPYMDAGRRVKRPRRRRSGSL
ncbi:Lsr2-like DNA bridging protein [Microbacterium phage PuffyCat]|uniref:Lsr2-like DNA bridging protein n=1 Tax=Microbacterium phage Nobel TaxID=2725614 RepID=A0A6M3TAP5_9CAUD|nr:Lsr2-like DNA bridging protein [Microbacterium phage Nobel]QJD50744.1 Lsr2-like DNA bridging protein [Microbacterium phage Nobel]QKY79174.1 Lsr2-like DNA bridging protein [Microbacterium phage TinyTruffula]WMI34012.1 Lsr2-like DNA bridging protein [Microbacterium phage Clownery]WNN94227.1 Lsr2-like DNA bridging protein [Microbacterium phage PuffyCat]